MSVWGSGIRSEEHTSELQSPRSTLFPYTTLFRSRRGRRRRKVRRHGQSRQVLASHPHSWMGCPCGGQESDRKSTRLNSSHRDLHSFPTRRSSDLVEVEGVVKSAVMDRAGRFSLVIHTLGWDVRVGVRN